MEEIRTSDALDREILEDARKKAERILKQVEADSGLVRAEWENKTRTEIALLEERMGARARLYEEEVEARAPLEKKRRKIDFIEGKLRQAMSSTLSGMEPKERQGIIEERLRRAAQFFSGKSVIVEALGIPGAQAGDLVLRAIPAAKLVRVDERAVSGEEAGILVSVEDGSARYRANLSELKAELLDSHREELAKALYSELDKI